MAEGWDMDLQQKVLELLLKTTFLDCRLVKL